MFSFNWTVNIILIRALTHPMTSRTHKCTVEYAFVRNLVFGPILYCSKFTKFTSMKPYQRKIILEFVHPALEYVTDKSCSRPNTLKQTDPTN